MGKNFNDKSKIKELNDIEYDDLILDIGPKTINKIKNIIIKNNLNLIFFHITHPRLLFVFVLFYHLRL